MSIYQIVPPSPQWWLVIANRSNIKGGLMPSNIFRRALLIGSLILLGLPVNERANAGQQGSQPDDQKYVGTWVGTYSTDNGFTDKLSCLLSKDEKGQWRGTIKFSNLGGEHMGEFKSLQIADGKFKAKLESPDGQVETTFDGVFQSDSLEGTYAASPKGSTESVERGTWKTTKSAPPKTGQ
jgi:hypothetical protein